MVSQDPGGAGQDLLEGRALANDVCEDLRALLVRCSGCLSEALGAALNGCFECVGAEFQILWPDEIVGRSSGGDLGRDAPTRVRTNYI